MVSRRNAKKLALDRNKTMSSFSLIAREKGIAKVVVFLWIDLTQRNPSLRDENELKRDVCIMYNILGV